MRYLSHSMLHWFNEQAIDAKEVVEGRFLYGSALNSAYREYTDRQGQFNLYDALEFQRFRRVDLFAENILSVYDKLTLFSKHNFLAEVLTLLLVQLKTLESPKGFALTVQKDSLRYFEQLKFLGTRANNEKVEIEVSALLAAGVECRFGYNNRYVAEMSMNDLSALACDFLDILQEEEYSQFVNLPAVVVLYALNLGKNDQVNECLRKIIRHLAPSWKKEILHTLSDTKSVADYENKKKALLTSTVKLSTEPLHLISVDCSGDLDAAIADSEFDYEVESRILKGRARAVSKIAKWWRGKRIELKEKRGSAANYFEYALKPSEAVDAKRVDLLGDIRMIRSIHKGRTLSDLSLLVRT